MDWSKLSRTNTGENTVSKEKDKMTKPILHDSLLPEIDNDMFKALKYISDFFNVAMLVWRDSLRLR